MRRECLPIEQLQAWSLLNDVKLANAAVAANITGKDGTNKGAGLVATEAIPRQAFESLLLTVPADLIVSKNRVEQVARTDKYLREILIATGEWAQVGKRTLLRPDADLITLLEA